GTSPIRLVASSGLNAASTSPTSIAIDFIMSSFRWRQFRGVSFDLPIHLSAKPVGIAKVSFRTSWPADMCGRTQSGSPEIKGKWARRLRRRAH
ncbi:MAG: hypothetical protein KKF33_13000, partial [Alphaproteobacteria bacterium]|nr:hypothetical protein [Alphaproteobacteria bacterium]